MKNLTKLLGANIVALLVFVSPVYALDTKTYLNGAVNATIDAGTKVDANINANVNSNTGIEVDDYSANANSNIESETDVSLEVNTLGIAITSSAQVNSEEDLEVFNSNAVVKDKMVAKVDANSDDDAKTEIKVVYKHKGRFLGLIPVTIKSTTVVEEQANAEAKIDSGLSWWSFLVAGENYNKADLEARLKNNPRVKAGARANLSAQAKAQIAEAIIAELKASVAAEANAEVK